MPRCRTELTELVDDHVGTIFVGDFNVHHRRWLIHSNKNSLEGKLLYDISVDFGLKQGVREPTRGNHLLDLVLSDMLSMSAIQVLPPIADHNFVLATFDVATASADPIDRFVWDYRKADWDSLRKDLKGVDWKSIVMEISVDEAACRLTEKITEIAKLHIPHRVARFSKKSHPWLTNRALRAIQTKCAAFGTDHFETATQKCKEIIAEEYRSHRQKLRSKIKNLKRGSKQWWSLNRQLLDKTSKIDSMPPLKNSLGEFLVEMHAAGSTCSGDGIPRASCHTFGFSVDSDSVGAEDPKGHRSVEGYGARWAAGTNPARMCCGACASYRDVREETSQRGCLAGAVADSLDPPVVQKGIRLQQHELPWRALDDCAEQNGREGNLFGLCAVLG